jgi:hypothetical protein
VGGDLDSGAIERDGGKAENGLATAPGGAEEGLESEGRPGLARVWRAL